MSSLKDGLSNVFATAQPRISAVVDALPANTKEMATAFAIVAPVSYIVWNWLLYPLYFTPLLKMPGPPVSWVPFAGNYLELVGAEVTVPQIEWAQKYGGIVHYHGRFNRSRILLTDPKLIQEVLVHRCYEFPKTSMLRKSMSGILGSGVLLAEGDEHKYQRRMLSPVFAHKNIKNMMPIFLGTAEKIVKIWHAELIGKDEVELDILRSMSNVTLEIIGLAGFNYRFNAIATDGEKPAPLATAYSLLFKPSATLLRVFGQIFPFIQYIPLKHNRELQWGMRTLDDVSKQLVREAKERAQHLKEDEDIKREGRVGDLLTLMANEYNPETDERMNDEDLQAQIMTFLAAGHETTSVSTTWALYHLARNPTVQARLRDEVTPLFRSSDHAHPSYDEIESLKLLNAVVKEVLRLIPPIPITVRVAKADTTVGDYFVPRDTQIAIGIGVNSRNTDVWGEDALDFNPDRWLDPTNQANNVLQAQYIPFLIGPRSCIGYKFALMESKVLLGTLISQFMFKEKPNYVVTKAQAITWRPKPGMRLIVSKV